MIMSLKPAKNNIKMPKEMCAIQNAMVIKNETRRRQHFHRVM
jgi:hypothetical protein